MERRLGILEEGIWKIGKSIPINAVATLRLEGQLSIDILRQALVVSQCTHPLLYARVDCQAGRPRFVAETSPVVPLRVIKRTDDNQWMQEHEDETNTLISTNKAPLFQVVLLHGEKASDIIINVHHIVVHGRSLNFFVEDLLKNYNKILCGEKIDIPKVLAIPAVDERIPEEYRRIFSKRLLLWFRKERKRRKTEILRQLPMSQTHLAGNKAISRHIYHSLSKDETERLLHACRDHKTGVAGAMAAAMTMATGPLLKLSKEERLSVEILVDLRDHLSPPLTERICCFATGSVRTSYSITERTQFWSLAREVKSQWESAIDCGELFLPAYFFQRLLVRLPIPLRTWSKGVTSTIWVSNFGDIKIDRNYGGLRLKSLIHSPSLQLIRGGIMMTLWTFDEKANLVFTYPEPEIDRDFAKEVADNTMAIFKEQLFAHHKQSNL